MTVDFEPIWDRFMRDIGYNRRPGQEALVQAIANTVRNKGHLVARAGTGTGKSIAAVIPALAYARAGALTEQGPVIIATASKNLQGQYFNKDLPKMAEHYSDAHGTGFTFEVLKGKSNYLCRDRLKTPEGPIAESKLDALRTLPTTHNGDIAYLPLSLESREIRAVTISSGDCPGRNECLMAQDPDNPCYYEKQKARAMQVDVLVINHALLAQHIKIFTSTKGKIEILPIPSALVMDECHKFQGYMQGALGWALSTNRLFRWANDCLDTNESDRFKKLVKEFFAAIKSTRDETVTKFKKTPDVQQVVPRPFLRELALSAQMLEYIEDALEEWSEIARDSRENADWRKVRKTANLLADMEVLTKLDAMDNFWSEPASAPNNPTNQGVTLNYKPSTEKVAAYLLENYWMAYETPAILMSATPPSDPIAELGMPQDHDSFDASSPFDYKQNSRLFIAPSSGKPPQDYRERLLWEQRRHKMMLNLVASSDGRALLLFSAWNDLNAAYKAIAPAMEQAGVTVLKQDKEDETARDKLAALFKSDEHSVLFGTQSFFEGVDIPGNSLQLVVIYKLPFPALHDATRGGQLDFKTEMLPEMRQHLVQAAGRLIRSHDDRGLVAVLDNRLLTASYGKIILANVEPFNRMGHVDSLQDAMAYLESLEG